LETALPTFLPRSSFSPWSRRRGPFSPRAARCPSTG